MSSPYIDITLAFMKSFGITVHYDNYQVFYLTGNGVYRSQSDYQVEVDASSASYFFGVGGNS